MIIYIGCGIVIFSVLMMIITLFVFPKQREKKMKDIEKNIIG